MDTAGSWRRGNTIWTGGSRLGNGSVEAACAWRTPEEWTGRHFHLGNNKERFDAEVYVIYQALSIVDQRQETGRQCTIFADSTAAIERGGPAPSARDSTLRSQPLRWVPGWCREATRSPSNGPRRIMGSWAMRPQARRQGPQRRATTPTMQYWTSLGGRQACPIWQGWRRRTAHGDGKVDLEPHWRPSAKVQPPPVKWA